MSRIPGSTQFNPFSFGIPALTPGPRGWMDSGDPNARACPGDTAGPLGVNDGAASLFEQANEFVSNHVITKDHKVHSRILDQMALAIPDFKYTVWNVAGALIYRVTQAKADLDGGPRTYHPPTEDHFDGKGPGLGRDSLLNATGNYKELQGNGPGCLLLKAYYKAKKLAGSADPAAKAALDQILQQQKVTTLEQLESKSKTAVCVVYIDGRSKEDSRKDWKHAKWVGVQTDGEGKPKIQQDGPNKGFYVPRMTPPWANGDEHPFVVLNPRLRKFSLDQGNYSALIVNEPNTKKAAFGIVADSGNKNELGECSQALINDLGDKGSAPTADYIFILFPGTGDKKEKPASQMRKDAKAHFDAWTVNGMQGMAAVEELFPTSDRYLKMNNQYLQGLTHQPGDFPASPLTPGKS